jgi:predicted murein hydrolase (TIGR00659 family)
MLGLPSPLFSSILFISLTLISYQIATYFQQKTQLIWLNPMLISICCVIPLLLLNNISFEQYSLATKPLYYLLEPAVVALGFPLYQQLNNLKNEWKIIISLLTLGVLIVVTLSLLLTMILIKTPEIAISLSLKSITTPIAIAITEQLQGDSSITAFAIIIAGLLGALLGPSWLKLINVHSAKAQGLAIGAASHVIGTAAISNISQEHSAYGSSALIISAVITALLSPFLITFLLSLFV